MQLCSLRPSSGTTLSSDSSTTWFVLLHPLPSFLQVDVVFWFKECAVPFRQPEAGHQDFALLSMISVKFCRLQLSRLVLETPWFSKTQLNCVILSLQLAVSPQIRVEGEPVMTTIGAHLVVKVEGVAQLTSQTLKKERKGYAARSFLVRKASPCS